MAELFALCMSSKSRNEIVADFFRLIGEGRPKDGLKYFAQNCIQHNPYVHGGMDALLESMAAVQREHGEFAESNILLKHVVGQGDIVVVHTQILFSQAEPGKGGLRQAHIFRFDRDDKIVEYWDITQVIQPDMPHAANAF